MTDPKSIAERATLSNFLNCYIRETGRGKRLPKHRCPLNTTFLQIPLYSQPLTLCIQVQYWSSTGRHWYELPIYMQALDHELIAIGSWAGMSLLIDDLAMGQGQPASNELLYLMLQSSRNLETIITARQGDEASLYRPDIQFIEAEQSLLFGHPFHPTPKSRQGFPEWRQHLYAPEMKGKFQLHYFAAHEDMVQQKAVTYQSASDLIEADLYEGLSAEELGRVHEMLDQLQLDTKHEYKLIPVHPVQAEWLLHQADVQPWLESRQLIYMGALGKAFSPTSSVRTVYHEASSYMYKFSLPVKITNSMRVNKRYELDGALEASQLMAGIMPALREHYPHFHIMSDLAYMTIGKDKDRETGFELLIRANSMQDDGIKSAVVMAAVTQETINGSRTWLEEVIGRLEQARTTNRDQLSREWFRKYLAISLEPMIWLYKQYGIALEAHLQNCVLVLDEAGYPKQLYYRDSQGYYYARSRLERLEGLLSGIRSSVNVYDDELVKERFGYYLIVNHLFGLIQAFGITGLAEERVLLLELHAAIESLMLSSNEDTADLLRSWINSPVLRCKANLLTRLYEVDELESELEQAVYVTITNPLCMEIPSMKLVRKARKVTQRWRREAMDAHMMNN